VKEQLVVAICDEYLSGKEIGKELKIVINEDFYGKEKIDDIRAIELMKKATVCNILGKKIIELALEKRFITKENIMFIDEIPHAQFIR
jgi:hypothetical protein